MRIVFFNFQDKGIQTKIHAQYNTTGLCRADVEREESCICCVNLRLSCLVNRLIFDVLNPPAANGLSCSFVCHGFQKRHVSWRAKFSFNLPPDGFNRDRRLLVQKAADKKWAIICCLSMGGNETQPPSFLCFCYWARTTGLQGNIVLVWLF